MGRTIEVDSLSYVCEKFILHNTDMHTNKVRKDVWSLFEIELNDKFDYFIDIGTDIFVR